MANSRKITLGLCRSVLRRWFADSRGCPVDFDGLPEAQQRTIEWAADTASRMKGDVKGAIEETYRSVATSRLDSAEGLAGPHGGET